MRTTRSLGCLAALTVTLHASAQVAWDTNGNNISFGEWFGADNSSTIPLEIRHNANQPIDWYTNAIRRLTLLPDATYMVDPNLPAKNADGWMLLCPEVDAYYGWGNPGPHSLFHLADGQGGKQRLRQPRSARVHGGSWPG